MKKAIIVGCNGQDGRLLNCLLQKKDYRIINIDKNLTLNPGGSPAKAVNINNPDEVCHLLRRFKPDEIYYLAAFHHSSEDMPLDNIDLLRQSLDTNVLAFVNFLEGIKRYCPRSRIFYAASSHIFGEPDKKIQDENTPIKPNCIYGVTKASGLFACRLYREKFSIFASAGILYNHESSLRSAAFISKKIITSAINIKKQKQAKLIIGYLNAEIDWGYAPDYVKAMHMIINCKTAEDFIVATGKKHKVMDFVKIAFAYLGLDWKKYVQEDSSIILKKNYCRIGNPEKLIHRTGWRPTVDFKEMVKLLLIQECPSLKGHLACKIL